MYLITILLIIVAALMVLSGFLALVGSAKKERTRLAWFFIAMIGGMIWAIASGMYIVNLESSEEIMSWLAYSICLGSMIASIGLLGYSIPYNKVGKAILVALACLSAGLMLVPIFKYDVLPSITHGSINGFYLAYGILILVNFALTLWNTFMQIHAAHNKRVKKARIISLIGLACTLGFSLTFNMIFPFILSNFDFLWVGPLSTYALVLSFYLNLFDTHRITLSSAWFKVLSYVIIIASFAVVYMVLFFLIFTSLFRVPSPSFAVIMLNLIMVVIVLLLIPAITEVSALIKSLITIDRVDVGYVVKKLDKLSPQDINPQELADFLANHLHCEYIGFVIKKRLYESESSQFDTDTLKAIDSLKPAKHGIWQNLDTAGGKVLAKQKIVAVAELCDEKGNVFGQMLIGKPLRKRSFDREDLIHLELVVNLIATRLSHKKSARN